MKLKEYKFILLIIIATFNVVKGQNKIYGLIEIEEDGFSNDQVFIYDGNNKFLTTTNKEGYYEFFTDKTQMNIIFLLVGSQYVQKEVNISKDTEINIVFEKKTEILSFRER